MVKRSTIGENPLDAMLQENPLDTVVPDLTVVARGGRVPSEALSDMEERVVALEAALKMLKTDVSGASAAAAAAAALKSVLANLQEELGRLRQDMEQVKADAATSQALAAEMAQLKEELAKVRASAAPGDLPFWMRGKKK